MKTLSIMLILAVMTPSFLVPVTVFAERNHGHDNNHGHESHDNDHHDDDSWDDEDDAPVVTPTPTPTPDTTAPIITPFGHGEVIIVVGSSYVDAGASAFDDVDGDITSQIVTVSTVDTNTVGTYTVTYNVTDSSGNHATEVVRTVIVVCGEDPEDVTPTPTPTPTPSVTPTPDPSVTPTPTPTPTPTVTPTPSVTPTPDNSSNQNGGSGSGPSVNSAPANGPIVGLIGSNGGQVLGAYVSSEDTSTCGIYMNQHLRFGSKKNNSAEVKKLQTFLNKHLGLNIPVTGYFGQATKDAVDMFQDKYSSEILAPWGEKKPTGIVYLSTLKKINEIECPSTKGALPELVPWSENPNAQ